MLKFIIELRKSIVQRTNQVDILLQCSELHKRIFTLAELSNFLNSGNSRPTPVIAYTIEKGVIFNVRQVFIKPLDIVLYFVFDAIRVGIVRGKDLYC